MRLPLHRRKRDLDARVASARHGAETAAREAELSRTRYEAIEQHIIKPLRRAAEENQFADLIRRSLIDGHHGGAR